LGAALAIVARPVFADADVPFCILDGPLAAFVRRRRYGAPTGCIGFAVKGPNAALNFPDCVATLQLPGIRPRWMSPGTWSK
jgi:hypothetical protein